MDSCKCCNEIFREIETMKADLRAVRRHKEDRRIRGQKKTFDRLTIKHISPELKSNDEKIQILLKECMRLLPDSQRTSCNECGKSLKNKHSLATHKSKYHNLEEKLTSEAVECVKTAMEK